MVFKTQLPGYLHILNYAERIEFAVENSRYNNIKQACKIGDFETADRIIKDLRNGGDGDIE